MRLPQRPPASFYVNAHHWQDDIAHVVDRVDHFVVHLSSLTEGSLWEIALLRTGDVSRIRPSCSIPPPCSEEDSQRASTAPWPPALRNLRWPGAARPDRSTTAEQWHERLSAEFHVLSPAESFASIDEIKDRISRSSGPPARDLDTTP